MSPRAAWRLERLGFENVYDYTAGKADWLAAGLPTERRATGPTRAIEVLDTAVATCAPDVQVKTLAAGDQGASGTSLVVVNDHNIVLGRLRLDRVDPHFVGTVEEVMEPGPATVRADAEVDATIVRLRARNVAEIIVTTPDGELLGVLRASGPAG